MPLFSHIVHVFFYLKQPKLFIKTKIIKNIEKKNYKPTTKGFEPGKLKNRQTTINIAGKTPLKPLIPEGDHKTEKLSKLTCFDLVMQV